MNLKDLAGELGLSQTTVSRALNGYPEVSEATRQRVLEAARRLDVPPAQCVGIEDSSNGIRSLKAAGT